MGFEIARADLQKLADEKLADARLLLGANSWSNAYYPAGYAVELALKACIAKLFKEETIPDNKLVNETYRHNLRDLVGTAKLSAELQKKTQADQEFAVNWGVVSSWSPDSRYQSATEQSAKELVAAIEDGTNGVLVWIKAHW